MEVLFFLTLLVYTVQHIMVFGAVTGTSESQLFIVSYFQEKLL